MVFDFRNSFNFIVLHKKVGFRLQRLKARVKKIKIYAHVVWSGDLMCFVGVSNVFMAVSAVAPSDQVYIVWYLFPYSFLKI